MSKPGDWEDEAYWRVVKQRDEARAEIERLRGLYEAESAEVKYRNTEVERLRAVLQLCRDLTSKGGLSGVWEAANEALGANEQTAPLARCRAEIACRYPACGDACPRRAGVWEAANEALGANEQGVRCRAEIACRYPACGEECPGRQK